MTDKFITDKSGVKIPEKLANTLASVQEVTPNGWNPNVMDTTMIGNLKKAILKDGFIVPVLVRSSSDEIFKWEIVDGEHRWKIAKEIGMENIPVIDCGDISDTDAKQITIKANALRGEFDSIQLAEMIKDMIKDTDMDQIVDSLPYSSEKITGMLNLLDSEINIDMPPGLGGDDDGDDDGGQKGHDEFKTFEPGNEKFDHQCPRCNFEFNKA